MCHHGGVDVIVCVVMMVSRHCLCRHGGFDVIVLVVIPVLQEDSKIERIEMQRQNLSQQLRTMLETNNNSNNPMARAAMQKRQMPPVILD